MTTHDPTQLRRQQIRSLVVQEAASLRNRARVRRASGALAACVLIVAGTLAVRMSFKPKPEPQPVVENGNSAPSPGNQTPPSTIRVLVLGDQMPDGVRLIQSSEPVRPLVDSRIAPPVAYLDDDDLLRLLESAGQPSAIVHAGGVARVLPRDFPSPDASQR